MIIHRLVNKTTWLSTGYAQSGWLYRRRLLSAVSGNTVECF